MEWLGFGCPCRVFLMKSMSEEYYYDDLTLAYFVGGTLLAFSSQELSSKVALHVFMDIITTPGHGHGSQRKKTSWRWHLQQLFFGWAHLSAALISLSVWFATFLIMMGCITRIQWIILQPSSSSSKSRSLLIISPLFSTWLETRDNIFLVNRQNLSQSHRFISILNCHADYSQPTTATTAIPYLVTSSLW